MTRIAGWRGGVDGFLRLSPALNTVASDLVTASAAIDGANLAAEGLDARNLDANTIIELETTGTRKGFLSAAAATTFQGDGVNDRYRNEGTTVSTISVPMELDWGAGYTIGADEYIKVDGIVHFGGTAINGLSHTIVAPYNSGVSVGVLVDSGAGYVNVGSRAIRGGITNNTGGIATLGDLLRGDSFDLCPKHIITSGTIAKIGLVVGVGLSAGIIATAANFQLSARIMKKVR